MAAVIVSIVLVLLPFVFRLDGRPHADWQQFLGRFHPLAVHLPIGFLVLLPLLEIGGVFRPALREAAGFVLGLAFAACLGALTLGYLLAYGSGDAGAGVTRHMWGGIALTIGVLVCMLARPSWLSGEASRIYPLMLGAVFLALVWTAHQGGSLTHGSNYLTEYAPVPLKRWMTIGTGQGDAPDAGSFYAMHIDPIFESNCVSCHGESKTRGGLRLDSYERLMKGGKDGPVIVAGKPGQSVLLERVTLPAGHKQFMPAEGRPPLRPEEIAWIRAWVQQDASPSVATLAGITINEEPKDAPLQQVGDYSAMIAEIRQMENGQGAKLVPVSSKPSDGLILNTVNVAASFGDAQLAQFQKFAPYIVEAELGRTAVTDACFDTLSKFTHLRALHLEGTAVTGAKLARLAPLTQLTYLNLSGTRVTSAATAPLASMQNLHHVYLFNTPAQPTVATADAAQPATRSAQ
jgi:uncharacterized membrane protein